MKSYSDFYAAGTFHRSTSHDRTTVHDPATGAPVAEVVLCSAADLDAALESARVGAETWARSTIEDRRRALQRLAGEVEARRDALVSALADEIGCPVWLGRLMQVPMAMKDFEFTIAGLDHVQWSETIGNGLVERVPVGVVAAITPWNFPLHQIVAKVAGALAAGCSIVLKPSELAPGAAQNFIEAVHAAGLPPGVVNMVWGGADLGAALVADRRVHQISFTGSTAVGRRVMSAAAERLARVTLELGGKSAAVVLDDADLEAALPVALRIGLANSGQACVSQSRIIVPRGRQDEVCERLVALTAAWPLGHPAEESTRLGPVATSVQWSHVDHLIGRGLEQGAVAICGGRGRPAGFEQGCYVAPTIFRDVTPDMDIAQQEVFGPVIAVMPASDEADAVRLANSTAYGLSGAVWSADLARATRVARQMRTGQVVVNGAAQNLATPFGGWGQSGFGRENGRFGIEECLQYRSMHGVAA